MNVKCNCINLLMYLTRSSSHCVTSDTTSTIYRTELEGMIVVCRKTRNLFALVIIWGGGGQSVKITSSTNSSEILWFKCIYTTILTCDLEVFKVNILFPMVDYVSAQCKVNCLDQLFVIL